MSSNHEDPSTPGSTMVQVVVDRFTGTGVDGQLDAHVLVDRSPTQSVTFVLSEQDRSLLQATSETDLSTLWRAALDEMTTRLSAELGYAGTRGLTHPIIVQSRLDARTIGDSDADADATVPLEYHSAGALLAEFAV